MVRSIAVLGRGRLAAEAVRTAANLGITVRKVVVNAHEPAWDLPLLSTVMQEEFPHAEVDLSGDWRSLIGVDVDVVLSVGYDRRIGPQLFSGPARVLNLHLGRLPEYRGMRPVNWTLANGDRQAGVTLHEVAAEFDTGRIVAQTVFTIDPNRMEVRDVYQMAVHAAEGILHHLMPYMDELAAVPQDESRARYYTLADAKRLGNRSGWTRAACS